jgi:hypothetical protein
LWKRFPARITAGNPSYQALSKITRHKTEICTTTVKSLVLYDCEKWAMTQQKKLSQNMRVKKHSERYVYGPLKDQNSCRI